MRDYIIAANWKMNFNLTDAFSHMQKLKPVSTIETHLYIPSIYLSTLNTTFGEQFKFGAQNISEHHSGAFTGEISAEMIKSIDIHTALVGHSERRALFNETDSIINQKIKQCLNNNINVIFCVGETLEEREANHTFDVINSQLDNGLKSISAADFKHITIAYEPVWAIGTGKTASAEQAQEVHKHIRTYLSGMYESLESTRILYGGSVKSSNIESLLNEEDIDGALIGGASLIADEFNTILEIASSLHSNK